MAMAVLTTAVLLTMIWLRSLHRGDEITFALFHRAHSVGWTSGKVSWWTWCAKSSCEIPTEWNAWEPSEYESNYFQDNSLIVASGWPHRRRLIASWTLARDFERLPELELQIRAAIVPRLPSAIALSSIATWECPCELLVIPLTLLSMHLLFFKLIPPASEKSRPTKQPESP